MRSINWVLALAASGLLSVACAARQESAAAPASDAAATNTSSEPFSPTGEMEVGMSFDEGEAPEDAEETVGGREPPPTQTYSPANKLSPEEKAAANAKAP
ncbi:MAG: hypothetical protein JW751_15895 [Polyangiaceae bacterium]|nr:hypothetical protein [Polyangiaceae bacterium]